MFVCVCVCWSTQLWVQGIPTVGVETPNIGEAGGRRGTRLGQTRELARLQVFLNITTRLLPYFYSRFLQAGETRTEACNSQTEERGSDRIDPLFLPDKLLELLGRGGAHQTSEGAQIALLSRFGLYQTSPDSSERQ